MLHNPLLGFSADLLGFFIVRVDRRADTQCDRAGVTHPGFAGPAITTVMGQGNDRHPGLRSQHAATVVELAMGTWGLSGAFRENHHPQSTFCLLYTSDAADD